MKHLFYSIILVFAMFALSCATLNNTKPEFRQYHMMDSSTWTMYKSKCRNFELLIRGPANKYEICLISAKKHPNLKYNWNLADKFYQFAISAEGQKNIANFGRKKYKQPLYYPDAL